MTLEILTSESLAPRRHGFFTRQGGASSGVFAGLNCGYGSADQHAVLSELGAPDEVRTRDGSETWAYWSVVDEKIVSESPEEIAARRREVTGKFLDKL